MYALTDSLLTGAYFRATRGYVEKNDGTIRPRTYDETFHGEKRIDWGEDVGWPESNESCTLFSYLFPYVESLTTVRIPDVPEDVPLPDAPKRPDAVVDAFLDLTRSLVGGGTRPPDTFRVRDDEVLTQYEYAKRIRCSPFFSKDWGVEKQGKEWKSECATSWSRSDVLKLLDRIGVDAKVAESAYDAAMDAIEEYDASYARYVIATAAISRENEETRAAYAAEFDRRREYRDRIDRVVRVWVRFNETIRIASMVAGEEEDDTNA